MLPVATFWIYVREFPREKAELCQVRTASGQAGQTQNRCDHRLKELVRSTQGIRANICLRCASTLAETKPANGKAELSSSLNRLVRTRMLTGQAGVRSNADPMPIFVRRF